MRIAHFSDTHVLSLKGVGPREFLNKRWTGAINLAMNRSKHYKVEVFEKLLEALADLELDHSVCTGDLVNLALTPEFERVSAMLGAVFTPETLTVVPGNHDYYCKDAVDDGRFERYFSAFQPGDGYPVIRDLDGVRIVGLNTAIPTPVFMATGEIGAAQLDAMDTALRAAPDKFRLLMLHHPLFPEPKRPADGMRRLKDATALRTRLTAMGDAGPDLVIHGHNHEYKPMALSTGAPVIQVASASRSGRHHRAEFNVYIIEDGKLTGLERHIHEPSTGKFICQSAPGSWS